VREEEVCPLSNVENYDVEWRRYTRLPVRERKKIEEQTRSLAPIIISYRTALVRGLFEFISLFQTIFNDV
jgi:hypothetical protein